jgi:hypothetical protein
MDSPHVVVVSVVVVVVHLNQHCDWRFADIVGPVHDYYVTSLLDCATFSECSELPEEKQTRRKLEILAFVGRILLGHGVCCCL